jgi:broad specificity phosphatase PhoE
MGNLYLVRHGQASFGAEDYDNLSELGHKQAECLGAYFKNKNMQFDAVIIGTLRRHTQTWQGIAKGAGFKHEPLELPGLNEYDSHAVIATIHPGKLEKPDTPDMYRHHFRLLKDGLTQWMNGVVSPAGMPSYDDFQQGVVNALDHVRKNHAADKTSGKSGNVLIVSSGGPISTAVGHIPRDHHRAKPAHPQHLHHRIRLHPQAPHAGDLQHPATFGGVAGLGNLCLITNIVHNRG